MQRPLLAMLNILALVLLGGCSSTMVTPTLSSIEGYTSEPQWSGERDYKLETNYGSIRVFNASDWELDTALLVEMVNRHGSTFSKSLDLRLFNDMYVIEDPQNGFDLSNHDGLIGLTVSAERVVWSVIPTGWAEKTEWYQGTCPGVKEKIRDTPGMYITMDIAHELLIHGIRRAGGSSPSENEECEAQVFERQVYKALDGRPLVREK